jgi:RNA 2',3'-cyclic 3'-phosphodiesterase
MSHRLFVALRPPASIRAQLQGFMGGISGARWQNDAQLHLTLRYIGAVERALAEEIALALSSLRAEPVTLCLSGVGQFDRKGVPESLWAGVIPKDEVTRLHKKIDRMISALGLDPEHRAFLPHITLARMNRKQAGTEDWLAANSGLSSAPFAMHAVILYESHLSGEGARYEPVARFPLKE